MFIGLDLLDFYCSRYWKTSNPVHCDRSRVDLAIGHHVRHPRFLLLHQGLQSEQQY